jgi:SAM-dependent methyltransferase
MTIKNQLFKFVEQLRYTFGVSFSNYAVDEELRSLKENLPEDFKNKQSVDLGCGDGKVSLKIKEFLDPESFLGVDLSESLVRSAIKKGLDAKVLDIENEHLTGELGILWGVVHHFTDPAGTLRKLVEKFNLLIIREPINPYRILEGGHRFDKDKVLEVVQLAGINLENCQIVDLENHNSLIIFARLGKTQKKFQLN